MNKFIVIPFVLLAMAANAQSSNNLSAKNQQTIDDLKKRISVIENGALTPSEKMYQDKIKHLEDSIITLNKMLAELPKIEIESANQFAENPAIIYFEMNQEHSNYDTIPELKHLLANFFENPTLRIKLVGYADSFGQAIYNLNLSKQRALSVKNYMVTEKNIPAFRVFFEGKGSSMSNSNEEKQHLDRKVEVFLVK